MKKKEIKQSKEIKQNVDKVFATLLEAGFKITWCGEQDGVGVTFFYSKEGNKKIMVNEASEGFNVYGELSEKKNGQAEIKAIKKFAGKPDRIPEDMLEIRVKECVDEAIDGVFETIAQEFGVTSGDFAPDQEMILDDAKEKVIGLVQDWHEQNDKAPEVK